MQARRASLSTSIEDRNLGPTAFSIRASVPLSFVAFSSLPTRRFSLQDFHAPVLSLRAVKAAVLVVFGALLFISIGLAARISPGLEQQVALPRDSYLQVS